MEEKLIFVVYLSLSKTFVCLLLNINNALLVTLLFPFVEFLELVKLLLRVRIDLVDRDLKLSFFLLKLIFKLTDLILHASIRLIHLTLMHGVLFLA